MEFTNAIGLLWQMTKPLVRQQLHATIDGCRAVVEFEGYIYQVDVKAITKVPETRMKDVGLEEQQEQDYVAPDGSV